MSQNSRAAGLSSLLSAAAPTADEDESFAAHRARHGGEGEQAEATPEKPARLPAHRSNRSSGALANRGGPAVLPRERKKRIPKDKLTVQIPVAVIDALAVLVERDGTRRYDEVEEALRVHLKKKGVQLDEE